jgi:hypothetical protein
MTVLRVVAGAMSVNAHHSVLLGFLTINVRETIVPVLFLHVLRLSSEVVPISSLGIETTYINIVSKIVLEGEVTCLLHRMTPKKR